MNENDANAAAATAEAIQKAQLAKKIQDTEYVKKLASTAHRLISQAPFDGAEAPAVAEVLSWLDATVKGSDRQIVLLSMTTVQSPQAPIKPEVVSSGN